MVPLERHADDGGSFTELARLVDGRPAALAGFDVRQINYSELEPGTVKAFHVHARQTDVWYVPPSDRMLVVLVDVREGSTTEGVRMRLVLGNGTSRLLCVPPGVAHGVKNIGLAPGRIIYLVDQAFTPDPARCDEGRLPWDFAGADVWDVARG
jgi:dTDP-4-dehydrorhamnose 3,5-epimerase